MSRDFLNDTIDYEFAYDVFKKNDADYAALAATVGTEARLFELCVKVMCFAFQKDQISPQFWKIKSYAAKSQFSATWKQKMVTEANDYQGVGFTQARSYVELNVLSNMSVVCKICNGVGHKADKNCPLNKKVTKELCRKPSFAPLWAKYKNSFSQKAAGEEAKQAVIGKRVAQYCLMDNAKNQRQKGEKSNDINAQLDSMIAGLNEEITAATNLKTS